MKTNKRILSAVLAATTALSSYAVYAEEAATDATEAASSDVSSASIPDNFGGTLDNATKTVFTNYLGTTTATFANNTVTVKFSKPKSAYTDNGKVDGADPVYLVLTTDISSDVKAAGVGETTEENGFQFTGGYGFDVGDHHEFNFANQKIMLWLPAVFTDDTHTVKYKVGNDGEEKSFTIKYEYATEVSDIKVYMGNSDATGTVEAPETMTGNANLANYKHNRALYSGSIVKGNDNTYTLNINAQYGAMKGTAAAGEGGKNVLAVLEIDATEGKTIGTDYKIYKNDTEIDDVGGWLTHGSKFISGNDEEKEGKTYVTLWISLTDARVNGEEDITYTIKDENSNVISTINVNINDTTEYTLNATMPTVENCTVTASAVTNGKTTVTVTPSADKFITGGTVAGAALVPAAGKAWSAEIDVKSLLTSEEKAAGTTEATLKAEHISATIADKSDITVTNITLAKESPETITGEAAVNKYTQNRNAVVEVGAYDTENNIVTVKVASELLSGDNTGASNGANICLVMELETKVEKVDGSYGLGSYIETIDVDDGYKFIDEVNAENLGKYAVLWINAHEGAFTNGTKTVVYKDKDNKVMTTVKLVDVPVIKPVNLRDISRVTLTSASDTASIISAVKAKLGDKADLVSISVGNIPANTSTETTLDGDVTVTVSAANGKDVVFVNENNEIIGSLEATVPVTVPQKTSTPTRPSGGSSGGGGGSSSGGSGSTSTYLDVTNKTISSTANAVNGTVRVDANSSDNSGAAVKVAKSDAAVSYVKIDAPTTTREAADWAEPIVKKASSDKLADVKKAAEEAINAVADNKGFALNVDILNADRKTVVPGKNVVVTVPVPSAYNGKTLYAYRVTERGVVPILASTANNKITFNAGGAGEYIFTTEKLANAPKYIKGNVDLDSNTTSKDATQVLKYIVELATLKDEKLYIADVNGDGTVNAKDATEILKIVVGLSK